MPGAVGAFLVVVVVGVLLLTRRERRAVRSPNDFFAQVEDLFCIRLSEAEREAFFDPREGVQVIAGIVPLTAGPPLLDLAVQEVRAAVRDVTGAGDWDLAQSASLERMLPRRGRRRLWRRLCDRLALEDRPRLVLPPLLARTAVGVVAGAVLAWLVFRDSAWAVVAAGGAVVALAARPLLATRVPPDCATVEALAEYVVLDPKLRQRVNGDEASWSREQIAEALALLAEPPRRWGEVFD